MICKIADFFIDFQNTGYNFTETLKSYICDSDISDFNIHITVEDAELEKSKAEKKNEFLGYYAVFTAFRKLAEWLPLNNAFVLHSVAFDIAGTGVAFAAQSGTGKTTHMQLWQKYLGDKMTVVNGDKPIVRFFDGKPVPYAYGTPWNGKEKFGCNMRTPLTHPCFIERSETNFVTPADKNEVIEKIMNQVYMPTAPDAMLKTMELIDRLLSSCRLWIIHCNMEPDAAEVAYKTIFNSEE